MTKRKKYVDDLDIQLSEDDRSGDEDSLIVDGVDYVNGIPMDLPQGEIFVVFISLCVVMHFKLRIYEVVESSK